MKYIQDKKAFNFKREFKKKIFDEISRVFCKITS